MKLLAILQVAPHQMYFIHNLKKKKNALNRFILLFIFYDNKF